MRIKFWKESKRTDLLPRASSFDRSTARSGKSKCELPGVGGYRIFYGMFEHETMLLVHAYAKKSQKAPKKELEAAFQRLVDAQKRGL